MNPKLHILLNKFLIVLFISISIPEASLLAQRNCGDFTLNEAREFYEVGRFSEVIKTLSPCLERGFTENQKVQAYRFLSMTYLALDSLKSANDAAGLLIKINPVFEPSLFDPPPFIAMINRIKQSGSMLQVTSVSKKVENLLEAPATVMIITEEDIENRGYTDLTALFHDLPGFDVSSTYSATFSNIFQRGYRSNNTDRTLFLIDGVEENDLWSNIAYLSHQYPISNVKKVEIVYGPASTMYGANAFVGVINVITKDPDELTKNSNFNIKANAGYGTYNTKYLDFTIGAKLKENISLSTSFKRFISDEMDLSAYEEFNFDPADYDKVDYKPLLSVYDNPVNFINDDNFATSADYYDIITSDQGDTIAAELNQTGQEAARNLDKSALDQIVNGSEVKYSNISDHWLFYGKLKISDFTLGYQIWKYEQGGINYFGDNRQAGADNGSTWIPKQSFYYIKYSKNISEKLSILNFLQYRLTAAEDGSRSVFLSNYSNGSYSESHFIQDKSPGWTTLYLYQISNQIRNEFKVLYAPRTNIDIVGGLEVRNSNLQGDYRVLANPTEGQNVIEDGSSSGDDLPGGNNFRIYDLGFYAQGTYNYKNLVRLTLGGRYDFNRIRVNDGYGYIFNPRIATVITPGKFIFKFIYASAFQNASNWTKYSLNPQRQLNNPTLEPEEVNNLEFHAAYRIGKNSIIDLVYYNSNYQGAVGTASVTLPDGTVTGQNQAIGQLKIHGLMSTFNYRYQSYGFYANFSYTNPRESILENGESSDEFRRLGDIANYRINAGVNALYLDHLNINLRINHISNRPVGEGTSVSGNPGNFPAVSLINGSFTYKGIVKGLSAQFVCNNILNREYFDPGVRSANGIAYAYRTPQKGRHFMLRVLYSLNSIEQ